MPTVLRVGPYRFFFYAEEGLEPPHVHIEAAEKRAKFWLTPIEETWNDGFRSGEIKAIERILTANVDSLLRHGMTSSLISDDLVPVSVSVDDITLSISFNGGLQLSTPVSRFPRLSQGTPSQRSNWRLIGRGDGIHWPKLDEDIWVASLLRLLNGRPATSFEEVPALIGDLLKTTQRLSSLFEGRSFTPDGHLVGSIGEVVAKYIYDLTLQPASTPQIDAHTRDGQSVQIKLTGAKGRSFAMRWSSQVKAQHAQLLLALKLTENGFKEIYNGPFPMDLLEGRSDTSNGQISIPVSKLVSRNPSLLPAVQSFESVNRWFPAQLSNVA